MTSGFGNLLAIALNITDCEREVSTRRKNFLKSVRVAAIFFLNLPGCWLLNYAVSTGTRGDGGQAMDMFIVLSHRF